MNPLYEAVSVYYNHFQSYGLFTEEEHAWEVLEIAIRGELEDKRLKPQVEGRGRTFVEGHNKLVEGPRSRSLSLMYPRESYEVRIRRIQTKPETSLKIERA